MGDALLATDRATILLKDVLHIPEAAANLFSITTATARDTKFQFGPTCCAIQQHGRDIGTAKRGPNGLYYIPSLRDAATALASFPSTETAELWHRRFGHLGYSNLETLVRQDMVDGINVPPNDFKSAKAAASRAVHLGQAPESALPYLQAGKHRTSLAPTHGPVRANAHAFTRRQQVCGHLPG